MTSRRYKKLALAIMAGAVAGLLIAVGYLLGRQAAVPRETDLHATLHARVPLDSNERAVLEAKEHAFQARRAEIEERLKASNAVLADAIAASPQWSPAVEEAMKDVESAAGRLQRETMVHVFEMRAGIKPEHRAAYDKVLVETLRRGAP